MNCAPRPAFARKALASFRLLLALIPASGHAQFRQLGKDFIIQVGATDASAGEQMRITSTGLVGIAK